MRTGKSARALASCLCFFMASPCRAELKDWLPWVMVAAGVGFTVRGLVPRHDTLHSEKTITEVTERSVVDRRWERITRLDRTYYYQAQALYVTTTNFRDEDLLTVIDTRTDTSYGYWQHPAGTLREDRTVNIHETVRIETDVNTRTEVESRREPRRDWGLVGIGSAFVLSGLLLRAANPDRVRWRADVHGDTTRLMWELRF